MMMVVDGDDDNHDDNNNDDAGDEACRRFISRHLMHGGSVASSFWLPRDGRPL